MDGRLHAAVYMVCYPERAVRVQGVFWGVHLYRLCAVHAGVAWESASMYSARGALADVVRGAGMEHVHGMVMY